MEEKEGMTTIWVSFSNKRRMDGAGNFKDRYNDILGRLLDVYEEVKAEQLLEEKMR